jgi:hypothetical protein
MCTGSGCTRPADARQATGSCRGGHLPATAVSAADTTVRTPTAVPEAAADSGRCRSVQGPLPGGHRSAGHGVHGGLRPAAAGLRRNPVIVIPAGREQPRTPCLLVCAGHSRWTPTVRTGGQRTRLADTMVAIPPAMWTATSAAGVSGHWGSGPSNSRQQNRLPPPALMTLPGRGKTIEHLHIRSQSGRSHPAGATIARSVAWCSTSDCRLQMDLACSGWVPRRSRRVETGPDGCRRIGWMIKRMIKGLPTEHRMAGRPAGPRARQAQSWPAGTVGSPG